jgi:hypothetical protein
MRKPSPCYRLLKMGRPVIPGGTQVVVRATGCAGAAAGRNEESGSYLVRFADGTETTAASGELTAFRLEQQDALPRPACPESLRPHVLYRCVAGSRAYGLETESSDNDWRGFRLPPAVELIAMLDTFLSRTVHQTYSGYVLSQFKKIEQDLRSHPQVRWKHVMHPILLPRGETEAWRLALHKELDAALEASRLPARHYYDRVNALQIRCRRIAASEE